MKKNKIKYFLPLLIWIASLSVVSAEDFVKLGNAAFKEGNFSDAVSYYEKALAEKKSASLYLSLGHAQGRLGQWDKAIQAYQSSVDLTKEEPSVEMLRFLGQAQYMSGRFDNALDTFQRVYVNTPESEDELWLARCFIQMHQWTRGQNILLNYLLKNPRNSEALELLAYLFAQSGRIDEAISVHKELVKSHPAQMRYLLALAKAQTAAKYYDQAIDTLEFAIHIRPEHTRETIQLLADLYVDRKMYRQAASCYQKIILLSNSPSVEDYYRLGYAYFQIGEFLSASQTFEKIRQIEPSNARTNLYLGRIAAETGKVQEARKYYLEAIKASESSKEPRLALAELELKNDRYNDAAVQFSKAIELGEQSVEVYYNYVLALISSKQFESAKDAVKEALKKHPADEQLNSLLDYLIKTSDVV